MDRETIPVYSMSAIDYVFLSGDRRITLNSAGTLKDGKPLEVAATAMFDPDFADKGLEDTIFRLDQMLLNKARGLNSEAIVVSVRYNVCGPMIYGTGTPVVEIPLK